jgi:hypothetical protein
MQKKARHIPARLFCFEVASSREHWRGVDASRHCCKRGIHLARPNADNGSPFRGNDVMRELKGTESCA